MANKSIEEKYKKLTDIEHILLRPGMYISSTKPSISMKWLIEDDKMVYREVSYISGFLKLYDEILMNSIDESKREGTKLKTIKVSIKDNKISVWDDGGIEVVKHKEQNMWIPEMIFSETKAGSNFDESDERTWSGMNGIGSVCVNIFSKEFTVSTCDAKNSFYQVFSNNMRDRTEPTIKKSKKNHTEISYIPDYEKFKMEGLDETHFNLLKKRTVDIAACNPGIKIYFNDQLIKSNTFPDYVSLYTDGAFYESNKEKTWSIGIAASNDGFRQVSFVNSTETYDGGTHVDYILNQIISELRLFFQKKHKVDIKPSEIKNHIFLFLNTTVINPSFSSQTKEKLITEVKDFGFTYQVSAKLIKEILKSEIVETILDWIARKKDAEANKLAREVNKNLAKIKVDKLIDAKGKNRQVCSLALFEGDCLHEDTLIRVIRDGDIIDTKIKHATTEDLVITHNNTISNIYAFTKKIKKKATIKINDEEIICSHEHKWFIYDKEINEFRFELTKNIDKTKHKLVKNYLAFTDALIVMESNDGYIVKLKSGEIINTNPEHQFAIYNREENKFEMRKNSEIDIYNHFLINTFKL